MKRSTTPSQKKHHRRISTDISGATNTKRQHRRINSNRATSTTTKHLHRHIKRNNDRINDNTGQKKPVPTTTRSTTVQTKKPLIPTYQQQPYHHRHIKSNNDRIKDTGIDISRETTIGSTTKLDKEEHLRRQRQDQQ